MFDFLYTTLDINWQASREVISIFLAIFIVWCLIEELSSKIRSLQDQDQHLQGSIERTRNGCYSKTQ